jgi:hypothetical protein
MLTTVSIGGIFGKISKLKKEGGIRNISTTVYSTIQNPQGHSVKIALNKLNVSTFSGPSP